MMTVHWPCKLGYLDASCALAIVTRGKIINGMKANDDWQRVHSLLMWWSLFQLSPTRRRLRVATPPRRRRATLSNSGVSLPDAFRAPDRKDSTPRHGRLLHPSSWAERDDRDHAAENFFQGGSPKTGHPPSSPGPPHRQKSFLTKFPGMRLGRKFETKKSPLPGGPYRGSAARQNEVGLAARAAPSCRAPAPAPPSCIAIAMRSMQPLFPLQLWTKI